MKTQELETTARARVAAGKGDLAADESVPTIEKRFKSINVPSTEESRQAYRELLFATPLATPAKTRAKPATRSKRPPGFL
jgi:fructose-bisphosphate aldolase, class I